MIKKLEELQKQIDILNIEKYPIQSQLWSIESDIEDLERQKRTIIHELSEEDFKKRLREGKVSSEEFIIRDKLERLENMMWGNIVCGNLSNDFEPQDLSKSCGEIKKIDEDEKK